MRKMALPPAIRNTMGSYDVFTQRQVFIVFLTDFFVVPLHNFYQEIPRDDRDQANGKR